MTQKQTKQQNEFSAEYSENSFWAKVKKYANVFGAPVLEPALKLYYSTLDKDTPLWAKSTIYGALGYLISPVDAIPDLIPVVGYSDDLGVLVLAVSTVAAHIKDEHVKKAKQTLKKWFD